MPFTDAERLNAIQSCRYCPMCHHADLSVTLTRRETYSARGRGLLLWSIEKGKIGWDSQVADVMYKFPADGLSKRVCAGHIPHDDLILDARARLVRAGAAPVSVARTKKNLKEHGNPWGTAESDLGARVGLKGRPAGTPQVLLYFGATARVHRPGAIDALLRLVRKAGVAFTYLPEEGDPGLLLHQLGEVEAAGEAASALGRKIEESHAARVVTADADAYRALKAGFGNVPPLAGAAVQHASEFLEELAKGGKLTFRPPAKRVAYHDPCALARFTPCLEAPRALLKRILGGAPAELPGNRELAECSGECGGLPFTNADLASAAAARRLEQAAGAGAGILAAGGTAAAAALAQANASALEIKDLVELAADCLAD